jgi:hypothetical protein
LQHITEHPLVAPLAAQRHTLRERRAVVERDRQAASIALIELRAAGATPAAVRTATRRLEELEEEIEIVDNDLRALTPELEAAESAAKSELRTTLQGEAVEVLEAFLAALEQMAAASTTYEAFCRQSHKVLGVSVLPMGLLDRWLASRRTEAHKTLAKLR